jgi:HD-like signal output (HDOD) protein
MHHHVGDILDIISQVQELPSLPQIVNHVLNVMDDARSNAGDVAHAVEEDPALTAKILRIANSAFYSPNREITSVSFAINRMGTTEVRNIIISTGVISAMHNKANRSIDYTEFWRHCICVAIGARIVNDFSPVAPKYFRPTENPYFVAGLLHDIGILILEQTLGAVYAEVLEHAHQTGKPLHEVERRILGSDHQEIGAFIAEKWHLPEIVSRTAKYHHNPENAPDELSTFIQVIHIADALCANTGVGEYMEEFLLDRISDTLEQLKISISDIENIAKKISEAEKDSNLLQLLIND